MTYAKWKFDLTILIKYSRQKNEINRMQQFF